MSEKLSEKSEMSDVALASSLVRDVAPLRGETVRGRIVLAARKLGWSYSRTRDVWYAQARRIDAGEMDDLRKAHEARRLAAATHEYLELRARISRIEAALLATDEAFHRPQIDALQQSVGGLGGMGLPRADGGDK